MMCIELPEETEARWTAEQEGIEAADQEAERIAVFCLSGLGHQALVEEDSGDAYFPRVHRWVWCEDCGTQLGELS